MLVLRGCWWVGGGGWLGEEGSGVGCQNCLRNQALVPKGPKVKARGSIESRRLGGCSSWNRVGHSWPKSCTSRRMDETLKIAGFTTYQYLSGG